MITVGILSVFSLVTIAAIYLIIRMERYEALHPPEPLESRSPRPKESSDDASSATALS